MIVPFVDIGEIVDHHSFNFLFIIHGMNVWEMFPIRNG